MEESCSNDHTRTEILGDEKGPFRHHNAFVSMSVYRKPCTYLALSSQNHSVQQLTLSTYRGTNKNHEDG